MSMTGRYLRVAPEVILDIQREPSTLLDVLYPEAESELAAHESKYLDIDKTWDIIHFLLNDGASIQDSDDGGGPLPNAVLGGAELTDEDLGYGPARFLVPAEVATTARGLACISPEELWGRFDESRVSAADLYWSMEPENKTYALENYEALRSFFLEASNAGDAVILWLA